MGPRRVKKTSPRADAGSLIFLPAAIFLLLGLVGFGYYWHALPRPVAAIGLTICGKVQAVTIVMNNGKMQRFDGPSKDGAALAAKVPDKNFSDFAVNGAFCSPPKEY